MKHDEKPLGVRSCPGCPPPVHTDHVDDIVCGGQVDPRSAALIINGDKALLPAQVSTARKDEYALMRTDHEKIRRKKQ